MGPREGLLLLGIAAAELAMSRALGLELFDTTSVRVQLIAGAMGLTVGILGAYVAMALAGFERQRRLPGALWAVLCWYFLFASHLAFVGYGLIPVEIGVSAFAVARRTACSPLRACMLAVVVRGLVLVTRLVVPGLQGVA